MAICEILRSNSRTKEYVQEGEREGKSLQDAMEAGSLEGMQTFDQELERLIGEGAIDREIGLSFATNRTNLQLRLDTLGDGAATGESIRLAPTEADLRRTGSFKAASPRAARGGASPDLEDFDREVGPCRHSAPSARPASRSTTRRSRTSPSRSAARSARR